MLHYRASEKPAQALQAELNAARADSVALVQADLLDIAGLPELVKNTLARFGRLDVLVNNASTFFPTPVGEITERHWDDLVGTNFKVPLFLSQAAAPALKKSGGCIVNLVDIHAERPLRGHVLYSAAKAALAGLTRSLARELGSEIRVNGVAPGAVLWPEAGKAAAERQRLIARTPLQRAGTPEDVAGAVLWLLRDATFVTGQIIRVDGGRSLAG